jgi:hypothetical protein
MGILYRNNHDLSKTQTRDRARAGWWVDGGTAGPPESNSIFPCAKLCQGVTAWLPVLNTCSQVGHFFRPRSTSALRTPLSDLHLSHHRTQIVRCNSQDSPGCCCSHPLNQTDASSQASRDTADRRAASSLRDRLSSRRVLRRAARMRGRATRKIFRFRCEMHRPVQFRKPHRLYTSCKTTSRRLLPSGDFAQNPPRPFGHSEMG